MKIRQKYFCGEDKVTIQYQYNKDGLIIGMTEINGDSITDEDEFTMPEIEVKGEFFTKIINHRKLK